MRKANFFLALFLSITFTGCSTILNNLPWVYTLDIQQGNVINQEMIDQLRPKMTKRQVLYIMGSSMLIDVFHRKRWDYLYSEQLSGEQRKQKRLSLFFDGELLTGIQGDFKPSSTPVTRKSENTTIDVPPRILEKTLWEKITGIFSDDTPETLEHETEVEKPIAAQTDSNQTAFNNELNESTQEAVKKKVNVESSLEAGNQITLEKVTNAKQISIIESKDKTSQIVQSSNKDKVILIAPLEEEDPQTLEKLADQ